MRRYDLDWLRVGVFALLIFYHVGMFFVPWGWHIKNNEIYSWLKWPMLFLNQWRLPILFVISGMGTAYALSSRSITEFRWERLRRLGIPLIFGILCIVPPQIYIERIVNHQFQGSYLSFWPIHMFDNGVYPEGNFSWHHLWFLPYLLVFSLLLSPLFAYLRAADKGLKAWLKVNLAKRPAMIYLFVFPLFLCESFLEPFFQVTHNLVWDWFNFVSSLFLFFFGFLLISLGEVYWVAIRKIWKVAIFIGIFCFTAQVFIWLYFEDSVIIHFTEAMFKTLNLWSWILALFGFADRFLNHKSTVLKYANEAVYPFYILHQTITILIAYAIYDKHWGLATKGILLVGGTFLFSWLIYEFLIKRIRFLRPLFGLKS